MKSTSIAADQQPQTTSRVEEASADYGVAHLPGADPLLDKANEVLDGLRRRVLGNEDHVDGRTLARLELIEAVTDAVLHLSNEAPMEGETSMRTEGTEPTTAEVRHAIRTLLASSGSSRRAQWERAVDALVACPAIDVDQLYQAYRHAERKRWLLANVALLGAADLARLMPDRVDADRNTARVLARLRAEGELLAVRVKRDWKYPAAQFDGRGEVHMVLPDLLRRATTCGYDTWEILYWLATPIAEAKDVAPGRPLDRPERFEASATIEDIATLAAARHDADESPFTASASPFELLEGGDADAFEKAARSWLG